MSELKEEAKVEKANMNKFKFEDESGKVEKAPKVFK